MLSIVIIKTKSLKNGAKLELSLVNDNDRNNAIIIPMRSVRGIEQISKDVNSLHNLLEKLTGDLVFWEDTIELKSK